MLRFFLISLVLHGLVIGAWHQLGSPAGTAPADTALSVTLLMTQPGSTALQQHPVRPPVETTEVAPTPDNPPARPRRDKPIAVTHTENQDPVPTAAAAPVPVTSPPSDTVTSPELASTEPAHGPENTGTVVKGRLIQQVRHALETYFRYPRRARRNGWEGTVTLVMQVQPNGQLTDIQVTGSSGIPILDRAALASAQAITRLPWAHDPHAPDYPMQITLPVQYRLMEG